MGEDYKPMEDFDCIPIANGFEIDEKSKTKAHIDDEDIKKKNVELISVLEKFSASAAKAEYIFAHNLNYNENVLGAEYEINKKNSINLYYLFQTEFNISTPESIYILGIGYSLTI